MNKLFSDISPKMYAISLLFMTAVSMIAILSMIFLDYRYAKKRHEAKMQLNKLMQQEIIAIKKMEKNIMKKTFKDMKGSVDS